MATMKAVNYTGPNKVQVQQVERPKLEHPDDVIVKVTTVRLSADSAWRTWVNLKHRLQSAARTYSEHPDNQTTMTIA